MKMLESPSAANHTTNLIKTLTFGSNSSIDYLTGDLFICSFFSELPVISAKFLIPVSLYFGETRFILALS